jgi:hypothetical protein
MEKIEETNRFEEFENNSNKRRRKLLPWWIKFFCWVFMIFGALALICFFLGFFNMSVDLSFYGLKTNQPFSLIGLIIISLALFKGFTAYSLWFENDNAINVAIVDSILGITLCSMSMFAFPFLGDENSFEFSFRLELVLLVPYLVKLNRIKKEWETVN